MRAEEEILNIDYNIQILCIKALNKFDYKRDAAKALGISERNLYRLIERYNIVRETAFGGRYFVAERVRCLRIA